MDPSTGRFTTQDSWMGRNNQPATLNKYLYGNANPANYTDPTGNFSIGGISTSLSVRGILGAAQGASGGYSMVSFVMGDREEMSAREVGFLVITSMLPGASGAKFMKMASSRIRRVCNSFDGETLVSTENGLKPISEIEIGEKVWAYNEESGETELQDVVHLIQREGEKEIVDITLESGEVIRATAGHPFYVQGDEWRWLDAGDLKQGDQLYGKDGDTVFIKAIDTASLNLPVYNLTIDNTHTYFVGSNVVLSHNAQKECNLDGLIIGAKKPAFKPNQKHRQGGGGRRPGLDAGIEPEDSLYAFQKLAVKADNGVWYAKSSDGKHIYRYFEDQGVAHWSGSTGDEKAKLSARNIPIAVRRALNFKSKNK